MRDKPATRWIGLGKMGLLLGLALLLFSGPSFAQVTNGRVSGTITDQSGAVIIGATITVTDVARGVTRTLTTDNAGEYAAYPLTPGTYTVRAEAMGFKTVDRTDITVGNGADVRVDLSLEPGAQNQTVTVTGDVPLINSTNAQLQQTLDTQTIADIPTNGRQYRALLQFRPGMTETPGAPSSRNATTYNGIHAEETVWLIDGLFAGNPYIDAPLVGGQQADAGPDEVTIMPLDAVQELDIVGNGKAEYGTRAGAQINLGLKSGTNQIHGSAFAFGRDDVLNAKNPFLTAAQEKAPYQLEQFGGSVGGPIKKDKLFYFGSYEGQRLGVGIPKVITEPTTSATATSANGFPAAIAALNAAGLNGRISPLSVNLAGCTPSTSTVAANITCNAAAGVFGNSGASTSYTTDLLDQGGSNNEIAKIDYHPNEHNAINGEYYSGRGNFLFPAASVQPYWRSLNTADAQFVRAVWVWTPNSTWVNEARFGFDYGVLPSYVGECNENIGQPNYATAFGFVSGAPPAAGSGLCGFPTTTVGTFTGLGYGTTPLTLDWTTLEGSDTVSYTHGRHLFKFGAELHHTNYYGSTYTDVKGAVSFGTGGVNATLPGIAAPTAIEDFLVGYNSTGAVLVGDANRTMLFWQSGFFFQDDWQVTSRLTVNMGLRYEADPAITVSNNLAGGFNPSTPTGLFQETSGNPIYKTDYNDFAPRFGLAWNLNSKGTTVLRAGIGVAHNGTPITLPLTTSGQGAAIQSIPTGFKLLVGGVNINPSAGASGTINTGTITASPGGLPWAVNTPVFGALTTGTPSCSSASPCSLAVLDPNYRLAYYTSWNLGIQHAFTNNLSADVSYVGNRGEKEPEAFDANAATPGPSGAATELLRRLYYGKFPYLSEVEWYTSSGFSNYEGLQATLTQRVAHGLSYTAGYTYSKALDMTAQDSGSPLAMVSSNPLLDYGPSGYDVRHHFTLSLTYVIPGKKGFGQVLEGWQINTATNIQSAVPVNPADTTDDLDGTGLNLDRWSMVGNPSAFSLGGPSPLPCYGWAGTGTSNVAINGNNYTFGKSTFAGQTNCQAVTTMPAPCVAAAAAEANSPSTVIPGAAGTSAAVNNTALYQLYSKGCYMAGNSVIVPPAQGTYGTMGRDFLRGRLFAQWDLSVGKDFKIKERLTAQFRAELYNVMNNAHYAAPGANPAAPNTFGESTSTPDSSNPVIGSGSPREIQLGLKLIF